MFTKACEIELIRKLPPEWLDSVRQTYDAYLEELRLELGEDAETGGPGADSSDPDFRPDTWENYLYCYLQAELQNALLE